MLTKNIAQDTTEKKLYKEEVHKIHNFSDDNNHTEQVAPLKSYNRNEELVSRMKMKMTNAHKGEHRIQKSL
jgi:hypothetical protein